MNAALFVDTLAMNKADLALEGSFLISISLLFSRACFHLAAESGASPLLSDFMMKVVEDVLSNDWANQEPETNQAILSSALLIGLGIRSRRELL